MSNKFDYQSNVKSSFAENQSFWEDKKVNLGTFGDLSHLSYDQDTPNWESKCEFEGQSEYEFENLEKDQDIHISDEFTEKVGHVKESLDFSKVHNSLSQKNSPVKHQDSDYKADGPIFQSRLELLAQRSRKFLSQSFITEPNDRRLSLINGREESNRRFSKITHHEEYEPEKEISYRAAYNSRNMSKSIIVDKPIEIDTTTHKSRFQSIVMSKQKASERSRSFVSLKESKALDVSATTINPCSKLKLSKEAQ